MSPSSTRSRVRSFLDTDESPAVVSRRVIADLRDEELRAALEVAMPYLVRDEIRKLRHVALGKPPVRGLDSWHEFAQPQPERSPTNGGDDLSRKRQEAGQKGFAAAQKIRDRDAALLRVPVYLESGESKALGDCSPDDLRSAACSQRKRAAENERRADGYEALASSLEAAGAATVRDYGSERVRDAVAV